MKKIFLLLTILTFSFNLYADALQLKPNHPETYIVKRGDTLWDISGKFLKQPWKWAEIWEINPQIKNPHLIYPGDVLSLIYIDGKPKITLNRGQSRGTVKLSPKVRTTPIIEPIPTISLKEINSFLVHNRIFTTQKEFNDNPYILAGKDGHLAGSIAGDLMYARGNFNYIPEVDSQEQEYIAEQIPDATDVDETFAITAPDDPCRPCDEPIIEVTKEEPIFEEPIIEEQPKHDGKYSLFVLGKTYTDPVTKKIIGINGDYVGSAETIDIQDDIAKVLITSTNRAVTAGTRLVIPEKDRDYKSSFILSAPAEKIEGMIIDVPRGAMRGGAYDVVVINKGLVDNIVEGNVLSIYKRSEKIKDRVSNQMINLPEEQVGFLMVFRAYDYVSYALVLETSAQVGTGYFLRNP